jgi:hypothetical protein
LHRQVPLEERIATSLLYGEDIRSSLVTLTIEPYILNYDLAEIISIYKS